MSDFLLTAYMGESSARCEKETRPAMVIGWFAYVFFKKCLFVWIFQGLFVFSHPPRLLKQIRNPSCSGRPVECRSLHR